MNSSESEVIVDSGGAGIGLPGPAIGDLNFRLNRTSVSTFCAQFPELVLNISNEFSFNCSHYNNQTEEFYLGEDMISGWVRLIVLILYGIVCIVGLCGNTLVIYVVIRFSKMHTVTNLYIVNLAIADECFLVGLPFLMTTTAVEYWPFGQFMCKMYLTTTGVNQVTSSLFLLVMSADRFIAVCHPISATKWRTPMISSLVTMTAWGLSAVIMVPIFIFGTTRQLGNTISCNIYWPKWMDDKTFMMYSFLFTFALPFVLISIFYVLVICRLRNVGPKRSIPQAQRPSYVPSTAAASETAGANNASPENCAHHHQQPPAKCSSGSGRSKDRRRSHRKVTKLVLTVISVYFLSWAPYWGLQLALATMENEITHSPALITIFLLSACLSYSNSAMNPILYAFLSDNFKKSFMKACSCANQRDVNAILHGETSAGLPRMKSAERLRRRKKSKNQHKLCLLHAKHKNHSRACGGVEHTDGICVVNTNGLSTAAHGGHSPPTPSEGILLRPGGIEDTEVLHSPCIEEDDARLFGGDCESDGDESSEDEGGGQRPQRGRDASVPALIDMDDDSYTRTNANGPRFGAQKQLPELFSLSPLNQGGTATGNSPSGFEGNGNEALMNSSSGAVPQTFVKDGVHMTEL